MTLDIQEYIQESYENELCAYWQKAHQLDELIKTSSGSQLRIKSINDRKKELEDIKKRRESFEVLFWDYLFIPTWFNERMSEVENNS